MRISIPRLAMPRLSRPRLAAALGVAMVLAFVLAFVFAATGHDSRDPFADSRPPPGLAERFYPPENWAWGLMSVGDGPIQRYGVAAPAVVSRADVLIVPDYGESAETWFETARDLTAAGDTVWVLEGVGQGGSARLTPRRDLGEVRGFGVDVAAVRGMIAAVIRPAPPRPLIVVGQGVGAFVVARALETGAAADGVVLSAPTCDEGLPGGLVVTLGLGGFRAPGADPWRRTGPDDLALHRTHDAWRGAVTHAWQLVNPDLRLGGPSLDWQTALTNLRAQTSGDLARLTTPVLTIEPSRDHPCLDAPGADVQQIPGADPALELEDEAHRTPWLTALQTFIDAAVKRAGPKLP